ncbi:unnamed protein product [Soboliphyme baturini]|uniref:S1 motif domain-containing protein n=1 Tax=Soboliphyme baturini TaxID=241478 RepID=A0A183IKH3_9BILA|nr:unnamed protein product [Soboliphyme baturini]
MWKKALGDAEQQALKVFARNYRQLLLTPPLKDCVILGIDPGFRHGCKYAFISALGIILNTGVFYLPQVNHCAKQDNTAINQLISFAVDARCEKIGIGNGTACRETECFIASLINSGAFRPYEVQYWCEGASPHDQRSSHGLYFSIVDESGASKYSISPEAVSDMPQLDPCLRSAVSIARRLQDPLSEYVKIDPGHVGVGMYQVRRDFLPMRLIWSCHLVLIFKHDISDRLLREALNSVAEECVSFVGVDVNTCSKSILCHVAGLNKRQAQEIINYREKKGPFVCREQLLAVPSIGPFTHQQCIGFLRVFCNERFNPEPMPVVAECSRKRKVTGDAKWSKSKKSKLSYAVDVFDRTAVHPESYGVAEKLLASIGMQKSDMFSDELRQKLKHLVIAIIVFLAFEKPLFKKDVISVSNVRVGDVLTGRVKNVTDFGVFVDAGLEFSGLVPISKMKNREFTVCF